MGGKEDSMLRNCPNESMLELAKNQLLRRRMNWGNEVYRHLSLFDGSLGEEMQKYGLGGSTVRYRFTNLHSEARIFG